ncbi:MAG: hypothetical protein KBA81_06405 [Rhabdochlamydiaceae bacterium]|nr:hypothetical protein [Rhabdochlamydiaceae bacterium]
MSITPFTSFILLTGGAAVDYFSQKPNEVKVKEEKTKDKTDKSPKEPKSSTTGEKLDTYLLMIKVVKKGLKYSKKSIQQVKFILKSGITSINWKDLIRSPDLSNLIRSPKAVESMILVLGTLGMAYSNFKPFKDQSSLFSKVTTIGGSLMAESKNILTMHQLMTSISNLAKNRKPPIKELSIAGAMILGSHIANRYSK